MASAAPLGGTACSEATPASERPLTWALCVATLNRIEALERCVDHALKQTRMPSEIVIADAGDSYLRDRSRIAARVAGHPAVALLHLQATIRSLTCQRNQTARAASADILVMIDDDAFMHPDCAERIMTAYEADTRKRIAAIACNDGPDLSGISERDVAVKRAGTRRNASLTRSLAASGLGRFVWREVFLMSADRHFIRYEDPPPVIQPEALQQLGIETCVPTTLIAGYALTVRRDVVLREPFEEAFLAYSPGEDLDASYRFTRHGANALMTNARLYHHNAAAGRLKRRTVAELGLCNLAFVVRKRSTNLPRDRARFMLMSLRRLLAETLKDGLSRRWSFPQLRGTVAALRRSARIFRADRDSLDAWYQAVQGEVLSRNSRATKP